MLLKRCSTVIMILYRYAFYTAAFCLLAFICSSVADNQIYHDDLYNEEAASAFFDKYKRDAELLVNRIMKARWAIFLNATERNIKAFENLTVLSSSFSKENMAELLKFDTNSFKNATLRRSFSRAFTLLGDSGISDEAQVFTWKKLKSDMSRAFTTAKLLLRNGTFVALEPHLGVFFQQSRDYDELAEVWRGWRDASGKKYRHLYPRYVNLSNEAIAEYGYSNYGAYLQASFETDDLPGQLNAIYSEIEPLYRLLHAYVKKKLAVMYPNRIRETVGALPAHLMGDMWAQQWHNIYEDIKPFKNKALLDVTPNMIAKNMSVHDMFRIAEDFFVSLGLDPLPNSFWTNSIFEKPNDGRDMNCHASAWDFFDGEDFRIKTCARVSMNDLFVIHHEMGHIQYYMNYKHQPFQFKEGANPGFHEALGDLMTLSVMTPNHLHKINLLGDFVEDEEFDINFLLFSALRSIAFAPFALAVENWRWNVYSGEIKTEDYNAEWWRLRCKYQGLVPPVDRHSDDFDPGAKYHVAASVPYDRYFVSLLLTFQFQEALCKASNFTGPLHKCDIYKSKEAGKILREMMQKGSSVHWSSVLHDLTRGATNKLEASSILEYFKPLHRWLLKQNLNETAAKDWHCENYVNKACRTVLSYENQQLFSGSSSISLHWLVFDLAVLLNSIYVY